MFDLKKLSICIVGLGYVGLPLAIEFGKKFPTVGFDVHRQRIIELNSKNDITLEVPSSDFDTAEFLKFTDKFDDIRYCNFYVVTVPTPIDKNKQPDLSFLNLASRTIGSVLKKGDIVVYESTVFPGATEEECVPIIEELSGLKLNQDFFVGYSPERINPGDRLHRLPMIKKVTSGSTREAADFIDSVYSQIITAGTFKADSIRIAEAAKVIENTQRDLNIALINELAIIFEKMNIDTLSVLEAAGTKWNFLPFRPGLVGGHCIGVDPYYLTYKAQSVGYHPEIILSGRRINDGMGNYIASKMVKEMLRKKIHVSGSNVLVMGFAFKENCPDHRNTKVIDIIEELASYDVNVDIYDPWVNMDTNSGYNILPFDDIKLAQYDGIIFAVAHQDFIERGAEAMRKFLREKAVVFDVKGIFPNENDYLRL